MADRPPPIDYQTPSAHSPPTWVYWPLAIPLLLIAGTLTVVLGMVVPKFETIVKDFRMNLPVSSRLLFGVSRLFRNYFGWMFVWAAVLTIPVVVAMARSRAPVSKSDRIQRNRLIMAATSLVILAILTLAILAIAPPLFNLISGLSAGP